MPFDLKVLVKEAQFLDVWLKLLKPILCQRWKEIFNEKFIFVLFQLAW